jgi:hypothetical protein
MKGANAIYDLACINFDCRLRDPIDFAVTVPVRVLFVVESY